MKKIFLIMLLFISVHDSIAHGLPDGFSHIQITAGINNPTVFDFAPDGRIFVAQQDGALRVIKNGVLLATPAIDLDVDMNGERGLIGIVVHPDFSTNHYIYLYYTVGSGVKRNKISRFTFSGDIINPSSEVVILELDPLSTANIHNSGCMKFSQDGKLFVSVGENNNSANSQNLDTYHGKILRINPDGSAPSDNPYASGSTPQQKRVWAMGLRNPFTFDIHPVNGKIYVNEVGHALWEEINDATSPGVNFGWPNDQGIVQGTTFKNPIFAYAHDGAALTGCAVTGGTFFSPVSTNYPSEYIGKYFFIDYCSNWIRYIDPTGNNPVSNEFAEELPATSLYLKTGPDGNLYFLSRSTGAINKIVYSLQSDPTITDQPDNLTLATTQTAHFHVTVSGAPPFSYQWKKNGTSISGANSNEYTISNVKITDEGNYSVVVTNSSNSITSNNAMLTVVNTTPPVGAISMPTNGSFYKAGDTINFSGTGYDQEDGNIPDSEFTWNIEFYHGTGSHQHVHDGPPIAIGVKSGSYIIPTNNETATDVFYRLKLSVKDSKNISTTSFVDILPKISTVSLKTSPEGFRVMLDGTARNTFFSFKSVAGIERSLSIVSPQTLNGITYTFDRWQNGGLATQVIKTPEQDFIYTAIFKEDTELRNPENPSNTIAGINYNYYEGTWLLLPDFNNISPVETGNVVTFNLSPKNRNEYFGLKYTGYIDIINDGVYKFYTSSNDGSKLYIGDRLVVSNDGQHANMEMAGTIGLKSGKHLITVVYFQNNGSSNLIVSYSANGLPKQEIPAARLFRSNGVTNAAPSVSITNPLNNEAFASSSNITISANANDSDGTISKVEFYQGDNKLGEDVSSPYQFLWNNVPNGNYVLKAIAFDNNNSSTVSSSINIKVENQSTTTCDVQGTISREYWTGVTGQLVSNIPINTLPSGTEALNSLEGPQNWGNNYGNRIRGYICAPTTGDYYFWIACNDAGELWLSTDDSPTNKIKIANVSTFTNYREWTKMASQKSSVVSLNAGQKYYIEALHKEGSNSDHISIGWQLPDGTLERPISGSRLSPYNGSNNIVPSVSIISPINNQSFTPTSNILITANASDVDGRVIKVEFYWGTQKLGEDTTSPYQYLWNNVGIGNYSITAKAYDNQNSFTTSAVANITVENSETMCHAQGKIYREYWTGVTGQLTSNIPTHVTPNGIEEIIIFEGPQNWANNYGTRIRGYICPPVTGDYYFWIACNDAGELWLSTDDNVSNKIKIAEVSTYSNYREWTKFTSQKSTAIRLEAGKKYYIEALHKEGINSDHISVGWQLPDGRLERPIPGSRLSPYIEAQAREAEAIKFSPEMEADSIYNITAYPNPIEKGEITLAISGYYNKTKAAIRITNQEGKEVFSEKVMCEKNCPRTLIPINEKFNQGIYIIYVTVENKVYHQKLLIK